MIETRFKYELDRTARIVTWSVAGGLVLAALLLGLFSPGRYLPVWFASITVAGVVLTLLSVPRAIRVTGEAVEIGCVLEITHIPREHIRSVRRIGPLERRNLVPIFASVGFFGWFGYWLDIQSWEFVKFYTSSREGLVEIEDIYEQRYVVNASDPDLLCRTIEKLQISGKLKIES